MKKLFFVLILISGIAYSVSNTDFNLLSRLYVPFPVASFEPVGSNQVMAVDVFPSPGADENSDNGYAWIDACDANLTSANGDVPVTCARMGIKSDRVEFGSREFDGGKAKNIYIIKGRKILAKFDDNGLTVFGEIKSIKPR